MSRIQQAFTKLEAHQRKALIPYITAGYPTAQQTVPFMHRMVKAGADILELGIPFSDPIADGPIIQEAAEVALAQNIGVTEVFDMVRQFRQQDTHTPLVLMGYANSIENYHFQQGQGRFAQTAKEVGVDGLVIVEYLPEMCRAFKSELDKLDIDLIFLLSPTSNTKRIQEVAKLASGYVYYVSLKGVTGANHLDIHSVSQKICDIQKHITIPISVGFGVHDTTSAQAIAKIANGVIIGSKLIQLIQSKGMDATESFIHQVRLAMDNPK
jgi:tryptophan synthase alpha chain